MPVKLLILPGQRFGRWTVLDPERHLGPDGWRAKARAAECRCDCGTIAIVKLGALTNGTSQSCGCLQREQASAWSRIPENIAPMLAARVPPSPEHIARSIERFRSPAHRKAVGDAARTHGLSRHPLYGTWRKMRRRCENPAVKDYPNYGARGVRVCNEWRDVAAFIAWIEANIGPRPPRMSLDRINPDGNYEPGNVRWATAAQQSANRRKAVWLGPDHWQVILAALSESGMPEAPATYMALAVQAEDLTRSRPIWEGVLSGDPLLFGGEDDATIAHYRRLVELALAEAEAAATGDEARRLITAAAADLRRNE